MYARYLLLALVIACIASCDSVPGSLPVAPEQPPKIEEFAIAPQRVVYALLDDSAIDGDSVKITLRLTATVKALKSRVAQVSYAVLSPDTTGDPVRIGTLSPAQNNRYAGDVNVTLSALDVQAYPVIVYVVDTNNRLGGEARTALEYVRSFEVGSPPVIETLTIPDRIQRPAAGQPARSLVFIAEVSDPDGLSNVELVEFWNISSPDSRILLCDDGNQRPCGRNAESGDAQAGDGLFTRRVFITSNNDLGVNTFRFEATDRAGLRSQQVSHTVEIFE